jgi:hypothetical protein
LSAARGARGGETGVEARILQATGARSSSSTLATKARLTSS